MIKEPKYMVKFTQAYNDNGTVWYTIQVFNAKEEQSWVFKERYSKMRTIHENCEKTKWKNDLPQFPPRKLFNNTNQQFIQKRKKQLQNYYSTLFRTIQIQDLQQVFKFFNTNKPIKEKQKPVQKNKQQQQQAKPQKKQKQMKKIFQEIVNSSQKEMVQSNEFNNDIQDQTRRKFNLEFQKLKLDLKSPLINAVLMPKGDKENDTDFWTVFVKDNHEDRLLKANEVGFKVSKYLKQTQNTKIRFVVPL